MSEILPWSGGMRALYIPKAAAFGYTLKWGGGLDFYKDGVFIGSFYPKGPFTMEDAIAAAEKCWNQRTANKTRERLKRDGELEEFYARAAGGEAVFLKMQIEKRRSGIEARNAMKFVVAASVLGSFR